MSFNMCTEDDIVVKAGANVNATIALSTATITKWADNAEAFINSATRINYSDTAAALNDDVKGILRDTCSSLAGMNLIRYDMSGYTSIYEAETMLDVLRDTYMMGISMLRDKKVTTFVDGA